MHVEAGKVALIHRLVDHPRLGSTSCFRLTAVFRGHPEVKVEAFPRCTSGVTQGKGSVTRVQENVT